MAPKIELAQAATSADVPAPAARSRRSIRRRWRTASCWAGEFWQTHPRLRQRRARPSSSITTGRRSTRSPTSGKLLAALQGLVSDDVHRRRRRAGFERAPMSVRVSPYLLSLIDWSDPVRAIRCARQFIPLGVAPPARSPEARPRLAARARRHAGARAHPPLRRQGAVPARSTPARSTAASARAATRSASTPKRSRSSTLKVERGALAAGVRVHRARAPSSRTSSSRAATRTSCAPSRSRRSARRCSTMPNVRRMRFATKGPAVMPQKILTDDAWIDALTARRRARAASCTRRWCCTRTSTTRNEITGDHRRRR